MPRDNRNPHFLWIEEQRDIQKQTTSFYFNLKPTGKGANENPLKKQGGTRFFRSASKLRCQVPGRTDVRRQGTGRWRMKDELGGSPHVFLLTIFFFGGRLVQQVVPCGVVFLEFFWRQIRVNFKKSVQNDNAIEVRGFKWCGWASKNLENPQDFLVRLPSQTLDQVPPSTENSVDIWQETIWYQLGKHVIHSFSNYFWLVFTVPTDQPDFGHTQCDVKLIQSYEPLNRVIPRFF